MISKCLILLLIQWNGCHKVDIQDRKIMRYTAAMECLGAILSRLALLVLPHPRLVVYGVE